MKQLLAFLLLVLSIPVQIFSQCPQSISFTEQNQLTDFPAAYPGCTDISGDVTIQGPDIQNIDVLSQIISIGGDLIINQTYLTNLNGLSSLQNVEGDVVITNNSSLLNLEGMNNLTNIDGNLYIRSNNALTSLDGLESLTTIVGTPGINAGFTLYENAGLSDISSLQSLTYIANGLGISANNLSTLTGLEHLQAIGTNLYIGDNQLVSLDGLQGLNSIGDYFYINNENNLTSVDGLLNLTNIVGDVFIINNDILTNLNGLENLEEIGGDLTISSNSNLSVCANEGICTVLANTTGLVVIGNNEPGCNTPEEVQTACLPIFNSVTGSLYADLNCNLIFDNDDVPLSFHLLKRADNNLPFSATNVDGDYLRLLPAEVSTEFIADSIPGYSMLPVSHTVVTDASIQNFPGRDFRFCPDSLFHNLSVTLVAFSPPRPGFSNQYQLCVENTGTYTEDALLTFNFSEAISGTYATITDPDGGIIDGPSVTWTLEDIAVFQTLCFTITVEMSSSTPLGTVLLPHGLVEGGDGITETTLIDNTVRIEETVIGSYDPNDKTVYPPHVDFEEIAAGARLRYTIRFQNTGTYPATFIEILDTLEENLDMTTFHMIAASHPYTMSFPSDRVLKWRFDNINLPDSAANELESHGFVHFSINTVPGLALTDVVSNTASIYFDFNTPVITNTATTSFFVSVKEVPIHNTLKISAFPNPTDATTELEYNLREASDCRIEITDTKGSILGYFNTGYQAAGGHTFPLNLAGLASGIYQVRLIALKETGVVKVVVW